MSFKNAKARQRRMRRWSRRRTLPSSPPGTIQVDPSSVPTTIRVMAYNSSDLFEGPVEQVGRLHDLLHKWPNVWIDVTGLGTAGTIQEIANLLDLHPLAIEDVVNVHQRAKVDAFKDHLYVVSRMFDGKDTRATEQISFFLRRGLLLTFQERPGDCWEPVRQRLRSARGRIRSASADHLMYALLDSIIDSYFPIIDSLSDRIDALDDEITRQLEPSQIHGIHALRGDLLAIRRAIRPHREMINELVRDDHGMISEETRVFLRDCYDHTIQLIDLVDTCRDLTADLREFYLSTVSNHMNEIMKVLTIMSSIFIPMSFVAGVYGMNFDTQSPWNMPELRWPHGYLFAWGIMLAIPVVLLVFFRRRRWL